MSKQKRNLIVCLAIIIGLGVVYFVVKKPKNGEEVNNAEEGTALGFVTQTDNFKGTEVTIKTETEEEKFVKDGINWVMVGKEKIGLVQLPIDQLIAYAKNLEYSQIVAETTSDLASYGLDRGNNIEIKGEDGTILKLAVGDATVDGLGYYVVADGQNKVFMVPEEAGEALKKAPSDFRDRYPEYVDYNNAKFITITKADGTSYTIEPNPNGAVTEGYGEYVLKGVYSQPMPILLEKLSTNIGGPIYDIGAVAFIDQPEDLSVYGLDKPQLIIAAEDMDGKSNTITIGNDASDLTVYAKFRNKDYVCTVNKAKVETVKDAKMFDIIGKFFITENAIDIKKVSLSHVDGTEAIFDIDSEANTITYNGKEISTEAFADVYKNIAALTRDGQAGTDAGEVEAQLTIEKTSGDVEEFVFYDYDVNYYAVETNGATEFLIGKKTIEVLFTAISNLE